MRGKLSYANLMATLAVFISLGAGAYAIGIGRGEIKSRHIGDNTIKSRDVRDRGLFGRDIHDETLSTRQIREDRLEASQFARVASGAGFCDPSGSAYVECASVTVGAEQVSDLLVVATGGQSGPGSGRCQISVDGTTMPGLPVDPGESSDHVNSGQENGFAITSVVPDLAAGSHVAALHCNEAVADTSIEANISVLALDAH